MCFLVYLFYLFFIIFFIEDPFSDGLAFNSRRLKSVFAHYRGITIEGIQFNGIFLVQITLRLRLPCPRTTAPLQ